jgi:pimeloyl-ACP methyl ester carboxylesterase
VNALRQHLERMAPQYPQLSLPIEVVHGSADRIVGLEIHSRRLAAEVAAADLTVLDGVGHMPHHARPDETLAAIRRAARRAGLGAGLR